MHQIEFYCPLSSSHSNHMFSTGSAIARLDLSKHSWVCACVSLALASHAWVLVAALRVYVPPLTPATQKVEMLTEASSRAHAHLDVLRLPWVSGWEPAMMSVSKSVSGEGAVTRLFFRLSHQDPFISLFVFMRTYISFTCFLYFIYFSFFFSLYCNNIKIIDWAPYGSV